MTVAFGAQLIANSHGNSQAQQDTERELRESPMHV